MLHAVARIKPSDAEIAGNPRSRSAVLRVAERTDVPWSSQPGAGESGKGRAKSGGKAGGKAGSKDVITKSGSVKGGRR